MTAGRGSVALETRTGRGLVRLLLARLVLSLTIFGVALVLDVLGLELGAGALQGLYGCVGFAFLATALSGLGLRFVGRERLLAGLQLPVDVAIVTGLVHFTGGQESVFLVLYALVTVYGAIWFERQGALGTATLCALGYGGVLFATNAGWVDGFGHRPDDTVLIAVWATHAGALFLVGALASVLSRELRRTGEALDQRTSDLRRLRDLHQRTVDSILSGLLTTDEEACISSFNPEAERITGASAPEVIGRPLEEVIPGAHEMMLGTSRDARPAGHRVRLKFRQRRGGEIYLGLAGSVLRDAEGRPLGHVLIFQDVTQVVEMEKDLARSERLAAVGELSAKIAHEIRNPLAAISGSIEILRGNLSTPGAESEPARLMDIVVRETERLDDLIGDFLRYARPRPLKLVSVRLDALARDVLEMLDASRPSRVELRAEGLAAAEVAGDADQLRQLLWNLCLNAVQAMPEGGRLEVSTQVGSQGALEAGRNGASGERVSEHWAEIAVQDEGVGMPPDVQARIFEPFYTTKPDGSGLGLATVHRIVESHGGALQIDSQPGQGTRVRVLLPVAAEAA